MHDFDNKQSKAKTLKEQIVTNGEKQIDLSYQRISFLRISSNCLVTSNNRYFAICILYFLASCVFLIDFVLIKNLNFFVFYEKEKKNDLI